MKMSIRTLWRPVKQILVVTRLITRVSGVSLETEVKSEKPKQEKYLQPEVFCQC